MMAPLWWAMAALSVLALVFFLWPLRRQATGSRVDQVRRQYLEANVTLFREHLAELEAARAAGRLSAEAFEQLKLEQERALLEEERELSTSKPIRGRALPGGRLVIAVAVVAIAGSILFYHWNGASDDVRLAAMQEEKAQLDQADRMNDRRVDPGRTWALIETLRERLKRDPEATQDWFLLANYSRELGHYDQAIEAYERILSLDSNSPRIRAELAETLFIRNDNQLSERSRRLVEQALAADPEQSKALGLAGIDAYQSGDYQTAIDHWQKAVDNMNPQSGNAMAFRRGIERARAALGGEDGAADAPAPSDSQSTPSESQEATIELPVRVRLGEQVPAEPEQWVFVYARAWEGSPMPLAITRLQANKLPASIILEDRKSVV